MMIVGAGDRLRVPAQNTDCSLAAAASISCAAAVAQRMYVISKIIMGPEAAAKEKADPTCLQLNQHMQNK